MVTTAPCSYLRMQPTVLNPKLSAEIQLVLDFGADQGANMMAIVYAEFENLEINSNKTVQYSVYKSEDGENSSEQCAIGLIGP